MSSGWLEAAGAALGVLGALLLATKHRLAPWAWVLWLGSNAGWVAFGVATGHWGVVAQNGVFALTSVMGIWLWLVKPGLPGWLRMVDSWACRQLLADMVRMFDGQPKARLRAAVAGRWVLWRRMGEGGSE